MKKKSNLLARAILAAGLVLALYLTGCASTTVYRGGKPIFKTQANAKNLAFTDGETSFRADVLDHATPTRAGGSVIGTAGSAATGIITSAIIR